MPGSSVNRSTTRPTPSSASSLCDCAHSTALLLLLLLLLLRQVVLLPSVLAVGEQAATPSASKAVLPSPNNSTRSALVPPLSLPPALALLLAVEQCSLRLVAPPRGTATACVTTVAAVEPAAPLVIDGVRPARACALVMASMMKSERIPVCGPLPPACMSTCRTASQ